MKKIIKNLYKNRVKNGGLPIVATIFETNTKNIIVTESNLRRGNTKWNDLHCTHAEWLCMDKIEELNKLKNISLIVSSSPCDKCANRILKNNYFDKIYYLIDKFDQSKNNNFLQICNLEKYIPKGKEEAENIRKINNHIQIANIQNKSKSLKRKKMKKM